MKSLWNILLATTLSLLLPLHTLASPASDDQPSTGHSKGHTCVACVVVVSVIEQLAQVHNSTVEASMERLCSYLPEKLFLKTTCYLVIRMFGPDLIKLLSANINADVVCHTLEFCKQDPGQPLCHLYPLPKEPWKFTLEKARQIVKKSPILKHSRSSSDICSLPFLAKICQRIKSTIQNSVPFKDVDSDKHSIFPTLRGYHWRGRDCNDSNRMAYPGRRPDNWDIHEDSNCNGIWGVDPKDGIPYEKKFCEGSQPRGIILLGDSAGAHFHISPEWITASQMSLVQKSFIDLPVALTNELDWPQLSGVTGFLDSISGIKENSVYLRLRKRNHCNHRDYQNISRNGGSSQNLEKFLETLSRNQLLDHPAIVIYAMIGNDVCNGKVDPIPEMTTPEKLYSSIMQTLKYLNSHLPNGSHVILYGLPDGTFLWDNLHNRYYPLGQLNKDVTYAHFYSFLNCLQVSPCHSWMSSNKTLRTLTSERAKQLSDTLKKIAASQKFTNFDLLYVDFDFQEVTEEWRKQGGQPWQLIEPVDGFHPNEVASQLLADSFWKKVQLQWPQVLGKENPFNSQIEQVFGDQGGH
ncbi:acyloxyacyl hydrolase isoform X1 [Mustela putorius furo]|uniref:Acyloxyacyl hydrolase n=1 Tax=Mustela putorius furo TaxID=9669 RepID=A0A8U0R7E1_MUSPF|nr:acyloxyacyl hydrolase isoform X1 [Mustela putorius furo]XP_044918812.1 acyloxyacyl hydrolase isoform X1 [Mustela putorius furo]XP_044918813.1 acyloxyacyl hydrolase isoform X1 [Mustela putorius furo]